MEQDHHARGKGLSNASKMKQQKGRSIFEGIRIFLSRTSATENASGQ